MMWWHSVEVRTAGTEVLASFCVGNDHRSSAGIAKHVRMIARRVGRVGRNGNAAGGHDPEIGDQPLGPVLADQRHAVAGLQPDTLERCARRRDLPRRLSPADRRHSPARLAHRNGLSPFSRARVQEQRNEIVETFELPSQ